MNSLPNDEVTEFNSILLRLWCFFEVFSCQYTFNTHESPLTFADLSKIEESFVNTLTSVYHARIEYPDSEENPAV